MSKLRIAGIDPGLTGAIAIIDIAFDDARKSSIIDARFHDMPITTLLDSRPMPCGRGVYKILSSECPDIVVLEHVESRPGQGSTSAFRFAQGFGATLSACQLCSPEISNTMLVRPRIWKAALGLSSSKPESLSLAREIFPELSDDLKRQKDDGRAEALLLTEFYRQHILPLAEVEVV